MQGRTDVGMQGTGQARYRRYLAQSRPGQPTTQFRKHELNRWRVDPGGSDSKLHPDGIGAAATDTSLQPVLATDGGRVRAGGIWHPIRWLYAPLPDGEVGRHPQAG